MSTTHTSSPAIDVSGISKTFNASSRSPVHALHDVSFTISQGEIVGLLGTNGAGKTTLIDLILGLTTPTSGAISVLGQAPLTAVKSGRVGAVMQSGGLLPDITVKETLELLGAAFPSHRPYADIIERANLGDILSRRVGKCSGGEQQRLRFGLALLGDPMLLLLDEPTAGMDASARRHFWETMHDEAKAGKTVLLTTHYLEEADTFAQRIIMLNRGKIHADGSTEEIRNADSTRVIRATFPGGVPDRLLNESLPGMLHQARTDSGLAITTRDSDAVARFLLTETTARDITISEQNLEDSFLELSSTSPDTITH
ncbi:ABC transporter ATP-binding protein [Corynebacterium singulare]|uniref:ABC transporter ATP-binding protein n=1 Tax=Corynebacterium singulare TaxID=161899 RepID=UPI001642B89E|nr:ABC transporter ATP-binding protein [Corynebacterium singulare]